MEDPFNWIVRFQIVGGLILGSVLGVIGLLAWAVFG